MAWLCVVSVGYLVLSIVGWLVDLACDWLAERRFVERTRGR